MCKRVSPTYNKLLLTHVLTALSGMVMCSPCDSGTPSSSCQWSYCGQGLIKLHFVAGS